MRAWFERKRKNHRRRIVLRQWRRFGSLIDVILRPLSSLTLATDAEATEAREFPLAVEHRQAGHLDNHLVIGIVDRPVQDDAAEGFRRRDGGSKPPRRV